MTTIHGLMQTIKDSVADLEVLINELDRPFAGMIDEEAQEQIEQERNVDHANDNRI